MLAHAFAVAAALSFCFLFIWAWFASRINYGFENLGLNSITTDRFRVFVVICVAVLFIWFGWFYVVQSFFPVPGNGKLSPGESGDMFGALTALFSGLAFAGLVSTLLLQRDDLIAQKKELKLTREEFERQRFEAKLFNVIGLWTEHIKSIVNERPTTQTGRDAISKMVRRLPKQYLITYDRNTYPPTPIQSVEPQTRQELVAGYQALYDKSFESDLGPYFRLFYRCIRIVEDADLPESDKTEYAKVVRAHLSAPELVLLLFNGLSENGILFRPLIEKYALLKHLPSEQALEYEKLVEAYDDRAFG